MTQHITSQMMSNTLLDAINTDLFQLSNTQNELSTGLKIERPSDDPFGAGESIDLSGQLASIDSFTTNIQDGLGWSQTSSSALQSIYQMGQTAQTLVVQANNGTQSQTDLNDIAQQVSQLIDSIKEAADSEYNGMHVFGGTITGSPPYAVGPGSSDAYTGNSGTITRQIGPGASSQVIINGDLGSVLGSGGGDGKLLSTLETIYTDLTTGNRPDLGNQLANIQGNLGQLQGLQSQLGASEDQLTLAGVRLRSLKTASSTVLASVQDVDMADASIRYSTEQASYQAALQSGAQLLQTSLLNFLKP